jgi:DNA-binding XRE family transcriptional regulator
MIERLKQLRELWGWSQAFIAAALTVSHSTISRWERGESAPTSTNQEKIDALVRAMEQASGPRQQPPEMRIAGDAVGGDQHIGRDRVGGDVITTTDGTTYVIRDSLVIVAPDADSLHKILSPRA